MNTHRFRSLRWLVFGFVILLVPLLATPASGQILGPYYGPGLRIGSPANHATFYTPVDIPIFAYLAAKSGLVTNVEFYAGTNDLGPGLDLGSSTVQRPPIYGNVIFGPSIPRLGAEYCLVWTNAPVGTFALTAVARTAYSFPGQTLAQTSAPVIVTIRSSPTNSNPVDVVSIVASDPIALAGTNSWTWVNPTNTTPSWSNWPPPVWHWYTNWGPKNALFTVRRMGDADTALTVNYQIGGTATNGSDYATLPGSLTIPAGSAYGLIPIVPIENGPSNYTRTVTLTLTGSSNTPPQYVLGFPTRAAALILKNWPRPLPLQIPGGGLHLNASGPDGAWFCVQSSSNLVDWTSISTNQAFQGSIDFIDSDGSSQARAFYRAVPVPNP